MFKYSMVIKHGVLENGSFISDFPKKTFIHRGFSSQLCLITGGWDIFPAPVKTIPELRGFRREAASGAPAPAAGRTGRALAPARAAVNAEQDRGVMGMEASIMVG